MANAGAFGQRRFQLGDFGPQDVAAVGEHRADRAVDRWTEAFALGGKVDKGNRVVHCREQGRGDDASVNNSLEPTPGPGLKHQCIPNEILPITPSFQVFLPFQANRLRRQHTRLLQAVFRQEFFGPVAQGTA